jgi:uncharacterized LabA/DUF88 family protein
MITGIRTTFLVDGFNLYHSAVQASRRLGGQGTKWLNIYSMCGSLLHMTGFGRSAQLGDVFYFSAYATHLLQTSPDTVRRHEDYIRCLESTGVKAALGRFKEKQIRCSSCGGQIIRHEEKETDVAIAVKLLELFIQDSCDLAIVVSGDTDLAPAVRAAQRLFTQKKVLFAFPFGRKNKELSTVAPGSFKISAQVYTIHQFPDPVILTDGTVIPKPASW